MNFLIHTVCKWSRYPQPKGWGLCFLATAVFSESPPSDCRSTLGSQACLFYSFFATSWAGSVSTHFTAVLPTGHAARQVRRLREGLPPLAHSSLQQCCIGLIWTLSTNFIGYCDVALHLISFAEQSVMPYTLFAIYIPQAKAWRFDRIVLKPL